MLGDFQFEGFIISNINYKTKSLKDCKKENELEFSYNLQNENNTYILSIRTNLINIQNDHYLDITLETRGRFVFIDDGSKEEREQLIKANGSAIMYPYIRSLIYNITSADTCGQAIILPTINFVKVIENIDNKNNNK